MPECVGTQSFEFLFSHKNLRMFVSTHVLVKLYDCLEMVIAYFAAPKQNSLM